MSAIFGRSPRLVLVGAVLAIPFGLQAQQRARPTFEVAAITPSAPINAAQLTSANLANLRFGLNVTEARVDIGFMTLGELLPRAFRVEAYQISGPTWLNDQRFDIHATIPAGATREQVPEMLQSLLAERFGMVTHSESRTLPVYELVTGKEGAKLREATEQPAAPSEPKPDELVVGAGENQMRVSRGAGPNPASAGLRVTTGRSAMDIKLGDNGMIQLDVSRMTLPEMVQLLTPFLGRPVIDKTGLTGTYQVRLELPLAEVASLIRTTGLGGLAGVGGAGAGPTVASPANGASDPGGSSILQAVERLGLKLESKRAPVDVVVVDKIEKNPTAN
ncbi:MAG TPA: TIGR03435 family protein [Vicinamibacterales bacterium]|nr:TIGR03435 family protein [Vicinamibacterales bacterium]